MIKEEIKRWWEEVSKYYQEEKKIPTKSAHYGPFAPYESKLKLLGNVRGKRILELGCGGGQCSIAFAKQGAISTGIDISKEQLNYAEALAKKSKINAKFLKGDIQTLTGIKSNTYDIVFSAFAFQYVPDFTKCFKEVYRVLKKKGLFVFSLDHPFYVLFDTKTSKIERSYYKTGNVVKIETWPDGTKHKFVRYNRKVSDIYNSLVEAKFFVERILEPLTLRGKEELEYPKKLVNLIGPTIIFKAKKL